MPRRLFNAANRPVIVPGAEKRAFRRPDLRDFWTPRQSAAPLGPDDSDQYDELVMHRSWRSYDPDLPSTVRYFMYEYSQRLPGQTEWFSCYKAVRFVRLTRVPRYLRSSGGSGAGPSAPGAVFSQQADLLAALREQQVLFVNLMAKSPELPLVFAYGVQAVGATEQEAMRKADESYAVLTFQLDGTYQQLEYAPITLGEGELLARYQMEWDHVSVARGRPMPEGSSLGTGALLDGNRTDAEQVNNQLESFIRGMADKSFLLSLITTPLRPTEVNQAWRNLTVKLSEVRSEQSGARAATAGVAMPLAMGANMGDTHGNSHSLGTSEALSHTDGLSHSVAEGTNQSVTEGTNQSVTQGVTQTEGVSATQSTTHSLSESLSESLTQGQSVGLTDSHSSNVGVSQSDSQSVSAGQSATEGLSLGQTQGVTQSASLTQGQSTNVGQSQTAGETAGTNWSSAQGVNSSATVTATDGSNQSTTQTHSQGWNAGGSLSQSAGSSASSGGGSNASAGLFGLGGGQNTNEGFGVNNTNTGGSSWGQNAGSSNAGQVGVSNSLANALSQGQSLTQTAGGAHSLSQSLTNSVGQSTSASATEGVATSTASSQSQSQSVGTSATQGVAASQGLTQGLTQGQALGQTQNLGSGQTASQAASVGQSSAVGQNSSVAQSQAQSVGASQSSTVGSSRTVTDGTSEAVSTQQAMQDAYQVAASRTAGTTGSLAVVPSFGVSISRNTYNESKRILGDVLAAQVDRYIEGIESGAFLYQVFLVCPDRETLAGATGLMKSAFWASGTHDRRLTQPFHTISKFDPDERRRLLAHAAALTSYRRRNPDMELIEPYLYSSYVTPGELAAFCHPPTSEALGLQAVTDSMPVLAMPSNRGSREITLGRIVNGERARVMDQGFGFDLDELTHVLLSGTSGQGKTNTLLNLLSDATRIRRRIVSSTAGGAPTAREVPTGVLCLDWMQQMRKLVPIVEPERLRFYSVSKPELGRLVWNPLALPANDMPLSEWLGKTADNFAASMGLGMSGRGLVSELISDLYSANRLQDYVLRPARADDNGSVIRHADVLAAIDPATLPDGAVRPGFDGEPVANCYTCPELTRLVGVQHLATLVAAKMEELASVEGARLYGTEMRDVVQNLWRSIQYFAPGADFAEVLWHDETLDERRCLGVSDLIDPDVGLVTLVEVDGLDQANRRLILGSILMACYRLGLFRGEGFYDHEGAGPGTFVVLEEAHELFGEKDEGEDNFSANTRTALYEEIFRRSRALGMRFVVACQNAGAIPEAVTSNTTTVIVHRTYADNDRARVFSLLNWSNQIMQQQREWRYLGEMPKGYAIVRLDAKESFLESAPVQIKTNLSPLQKVSDAELAARFQGRFVER